MQTMKTKTYILTVAPVGRHAEVDFAISGEKLEHLIALYYREGLNDPTLVLDLVPTASELGMTVEDMVAHWGGEGEVSSTRLVSIRGVREATQADLFIAFVDHVRRKAEYDAAKEALHAANLARHVAYARTQAMVNKINVLFPNWERKDVAFLKALAEGCTDEAARVFDAQQDAADRAYERHEKSMLNSE